MPQISCKNEIIAAALQTLHLQGYNATSVQDITAAANVPKGSFYNHFASKEALAAVVLEEYWQGIQGRLAMLKDKSIAPLTRLKRYFSALRDSGRAREFHSGCLMGNMAAEVAAQSKPLREQLTATWTAWSRALEACIAEAQADGSLRKDLSAATLASFLLNSWEGAVLRAKLDRNSAALDTFAKVTFTSLQA